MCIYLYIYIYIQYYIYVYIGPEGGPGDQGAPDIGGLRQGPPGAPGAVEERHRMNIIIIIYYYYYYYYYY